MIGVLAALIIAALLLTRYLRKRSRARRSMHRASMFEPWQTAAAEEEPYEKATYPMQETATPSYPPGQYPADSNYYGNQYPEGGFVGQEGYGAYPAFPAPGQYVDGAAAGAAGAAAGAGAYGAGQYGAEHGFNHADPAAAQRDVVGATSPVNHTSGLPLAAGAAAGAAVAGGAAAAAASGGAAAGGAPGALHDGMMVRVKVGFVRSLEDELAITQGQQLYLHTSYDDGWCLCEDDANNRGVVPVSCLEPWTQ